MITSEVSDKQWDDLVHSSDEGTVFHTTSWLNSSPHRFLKVGLIQNQSLTAGAVLQVDNQGRGTLGTSAPYLGPVFASDMAQRMDTVRRNRAEAALAQALSETVPGARFFVSPWLRDVRQFVMHNFQASVFYTTVVPTVSVSQTRLNFSAVLRRNLNSAKRVGLTTNSEVDPAEVIKLACTSFSRQGRRVWFSVEEVESCLRHLANMGKAAFFVTRDKHGVPVAAAALCWDWRRSYYILGGHDHLNAHRGGMSLTLFRALQFTCEELGLPELDLEGSHVAGIERFFRQFGGAWLPFYLVSTGSVEL